MKVWFWLGLLGSGVVASGVARADFVSADHRPLPWTGISKISEERASLLHAFARDLSPHERLATLEDVLRIHIKIVDAAEPRRQTSPLYHSEGVESGFANQILAGTARDFGMAFAWKGIFFSHNAALLGGPGAGDKLPLLLLDREATSVSIAFFLASRYLEVEALSHWKQKAGMVSLVPKWEAQIQKLPEVTPLVRSESHWANHLNYAEFFKVNLAWSSRLDALEWLSDEYETFRFDAESRRELKSNHESLLKAYFETFLWPLAAKLEFNLPYQTPARRQHSEMILAVVRTFEKQVDPNSLNQMRRPTYDLHNERDQQRLAHHASNPAYHLPEGSFVTDESKHTLEILPIRRGPFTDLLVVIDGENEKGVRAVLLRCVALTCGPKLRTPDDAAPFGVTKVLAGISGQSFFEHGLVSFASIENSAKIFSRFDEPKDFVFFVERKTLTQGGPPLGRFKAPENGTYRVVDDHPLILGGVPQKELNIAVTFSLGTGQDDANSFLAHHLVANFSQDERRLFFMTYHQNQFPGYLPRWSTPNFAKADLGMKVSERFVLLPETSVAGDLIQRIKILDTHAFDSEGTLKFKNFGTYQRVPEGARGAHR